MARIFFTAIVITYTVLHPVIHLTCRMWLNNINGDSFCLCIFIWESFCFYIFGCLFNFSYLFIYCCCCQAGSGLVGEDDPLGSGGAVAARIDSSYMINLRDLDMRHVKDFTFVHGKFDIVLFVTNLSLMQLC